ncbi:Uma2 family endonuclease [bacterium]|nr:MAG: Uma2 family endonuclease [bacterium]
MATITRPTTKGKTPLPAASRPFVSEDGLLAIKDWLALGDVKPRYELIHGKLVQKMTTSRRHTKAAGKFLIQCDIWGASKGWQFFPEGTGVYVSERVGYVPDVVGFEPDAQLDPDSVIDGSPFLVVEVLSPSTAAKDRNEKKVNYAKIGVKLYILIDPDTKTFEAHRLEGDQYGAPEALHNDDVWQPAELPGLRLELSQLWM